MKKLIMHFLIMFFILLIKTINAQTYTYNFSIDNEGWTGDFADYPVTDSLVCELAFYRSRLPLPLDTNKYSLFISGNNHSDDLFMFIKKKVAGLLPNTTYKLMIDINLASKYPTGTFGAGGSPGESVTIKAGATIIEPQKEIINNYYRINIDKGAQTVPGVDMDTLGNVGVTDTTSLYTLINRSNYSHLFNITTNSTGELWICIGTDSGFEATTSLYYNTIGLEFNIVTGIDDNPKGLSHEFLLFQNYPNPFNPITKIKYSIPQRSLVTLKVFDLLGKEIITLLNGEIMAGSYEYTFNASSLPSGVYFYKLQAGNYTQTKKLVFLK
jgi:hypothetical protein